MLRPEDLSDFELSHIRQLETLPLTGGKVVFLNGPPYSGKDTAGKVIKSEFHAVAQIKFSEPLKRAVFVEAGLNYNTPLDLFDKVKDVPLAMFGGRSFRQACIDKSERDIKPFYGSDWFGRLAVQDCGRKMQQGARLFVVSDSGFAPEAYPVIHAFGPHNCLLIRIHADGRGCSFKGDSRSYIELPDVPSLDIRNDGSLAEFNEEVVSAVGLAFFLKAP